MLLKHRFHDESWNRWPAEASRIDRQTYRKYSQKFGREIAVQKYLQWQFARQWQELRSYANERGIAVIGDIPIYVAYDSADVWSHRELFLLDAEGNPTVVAGVPPTGTSICGATRRRSTAKRASSFRISKFPTGPGTRWPRPITGTVSTLHGHRDGRPLPLVDILDQTPAIPEG
ncbi:MAG: hypothetical protein ACD_75C00476G0005 [uncultured bacterium]|nr:MAG: hypothetical protein ACD_75C00476G0005 [uncultured bacterium]